jgi:protein SCO1/2
LVAATLLTLAAGPAAARDIESADADPHAHHHQPQHQAESAPPFTRALERYQLPEVALVRADGTAVRFPQVIDDGRPVVLNFIYTSCTAICPLLSQTFSQFQTKLGAQAAEVQMVSISIDPEQDTPQRLAAYAKRFDAGPQWSHYTGTLEASVQIQRAFGAYYNDKMNHRPTTFLRAAPGQPWLRLDGFTTPDELVAQYRKLTAAD